MSCAAESRAKKLAETLINSSPRTTPGALTLQRTRTALAHSRLCSIYPNDCPSNYTTSSFALATFGFRLRNSLFHSIPLIRAFVYERLGSVEVELNSIPRPFTGNSFILVNELMTRFADTVRRHVNGTSQLDVSRRGLVQSLNAAYDKFKQEICQTAPAFDARKFAWGVSSPTTLYDRDGDGNERAVQPPRIIRIEQVSDLAKEFVATSTQLFKALTRFCRARTRELPGNVPFSVKKHYVDQFLATWDGPSKKCLRQSYQDFVTQIDRLVRQHFADYSSGGLLGIIQYATQHQLYSF
jgi:hypothetical protein